VPLNPPPPVAPPNPRIELACELAARYGRSGEWVINYRAKLERECEKAAFAGT
jgi:hypothetical protein